MLEKSDGKANGSHESKSLLPTGTSHVGKQRTTKEETALVSQQPLLGHDSTQFCLLISIAQSCNGEWKWKSQKAGKAREPFDEIFTSRSSRKSIKTCSVFRLLSRISRFVFCRRSPEISIEMSTAHLFWEHLKPVGEYFPSFAFAHTPWSSSNRQRKSNFFFFHRKHDSTLNKHQISDYARYLAGKNKLFLLADTESSGICCRDAMNEQINSSQKTFLCADNNRKLIKKVLHPPPSTRACSLQIDLITARMEIKIVDCMS